MNGKAVKLGISACLTGKEVRYDGGQKRDSFLIDTFGRFVDYVPVCPEVECGLGVPREPMRLEARGAETRLVRRLDGQDMTDQLVEWAERRLDELSKEGLWGFIFKSRSPSSGMERVLVYDERGRVVGRQGGIFATMFMERFPLIPVEDEEGLRDPENRENFIERLFAFRRWQETLAGEHNRQNLIDFHTANKLLILSHSPVHLREMGRMIGRAGELPAEELYRRYGELFQEGLCLKATRSKNANVLDHILGYFKRVFSSDEKKEMLDIIRFYRLGYLPLVVPITCFNHHLRRYDQPYLSGQVYLNPHPVEVQLRNHA